jgi:protein-L-isoaspartate(D-aspartate) O-methyltransferase
MSANASPAAGRSGSRFTAAADFEFARLEMISKQLRARGIRSIRVLEAMASVPRHLFVPPQHAANSYADSPLPIGEGQTISQPFMVASMAEELSLEGHEQVLEIGAGCGYQAAVLSLLARNVIAVESRSALATQARQRLAGLGYSNVRIEDGDGSLGWLPNAPYDAIVVSAGAPAVPPPLFDQLKERGRLIIPVGTTERQELQRIEKIDGRLTLQSRYDCRFVPLLGRYGWRPAEQSNQASQPDQDEQDASAG